MTADRATVKESIYEFVKEILGDKAEKSKIAIFIQIFSEFNGPARVAEQQAKELAGKGFDVTIFAFESDLTPPKDVKLEILRWPKNSVLSRVYLMIFPLNIVKAIKWTSRLKESDLIISHQYVLNWLAYFAKKFYGIKCVFYDHGNPYPELHSLAVRTYLKIMIGIEKWTIKKYDYAISVSKFMREELKKGIGFDSVVIYNKIDTKRFKEGRDGQVIRDRYDLNDDPIILYVGKISHYKGVHLLIEAFNLVKKKNPNVKLIIAGKVIFVDYSKKLKEISDDSVIFAGYVSDVDLPYYYAACDVYATCTLWEGFNLPLVEAQACGKPVVAFNHCSHPEVVQNGKTGYLTQPLDIPDMAKGIEMAYLNSEELSKNAEEWARKFSLYEFD